MSHILIYIVLTLHILPAYSALFSSLLLYVFQTHIHTINVL